MSRIRVKTGKLKLPFQTDSARQTSNLQAIIMMITAMATFAFGDTMIRLASLTGEGTTSGQFLMLQGVIGVCLFGWMMRRNGERIDATYLLDRNIQLRSFGDMLAAGCIVTSLLLLPVGTVSAILQIQPLMVTIAAVIILKEKVGLHRWSAILFGLIGGLIIMRPGLDGFEASSLLVLLGVVGLTMRDIYTRKLDRQFSSTAAVVVVSACLFPVGLALHLINGDGRGVFEIAPLPFLYLFLSSISTMIAYYILVLAMRVGEISAIAPYRYSRLIAAFLIAWLILGEVPDFYTLLGSVIVVAAGIAVVLRERQLAQKARI